MFSKKALNHCGGGAEANCWWSLGAAQAADSSRSQRQDPGFPHGDATGGWGPGRTGRFVGQLVDLLGWTVISPHR